MSSDRRDRLPGAESAKAEDSSTSSGGGDPRRLAAMHRRHIQRKAAREASAGRAKIPEGSGAPLEEGVRGRMEGALGADLSSVRVHTGSDSAAAAKGYAARAFTVGNDVHFNQGEFRPGSEDGDRLLAHELTHTMQGQRGGVQRKPEDDEEVSQPEDAAEVEADEAADRATEELHGEGAEEEAEPVAEPAPVSPKIFRTADPNAQTAGGPAPADGPVDKTDLAKDPAFHANAEKFERTLGLKLHSAQEPNEAAGKICDKIKVVCGKMSEKLKQGADAKDQAKLELKPMLSKLCGSDDPTVAGAVGGGAGNARDLDAMLKTDENVPEHQQAIEDVFREGNLRERMTVMFNFAGPFSDFVLGQGVDAAEQFGKDCGLSSDVKDRVSMAEQRKAGGGKLGSLQDRPEREELLDKQSQSREATTPRGVEAPRSLKTVEDEGAELNLSDREKKAGNPREVKETDAGGQEVVKHALNWVEGKDKWQRKLSSDFAKQLWQLSLPFGAGPSGTTDRLMETNRLLNSGVSPEEMRLVCMGYLLPIGAHSLVEILIACKNFNLDFPMGPEMYANIPPLDKTLLESCWPGGKFPPEVDPTADPNQQPVDPNQQPGGGS